MMIRTLALVSCWMLTACDHQPLATDGDGEFVIVGKCAPTEVAAALEEHLDATLVVDFGPDTANLTAAANAAGRATPPFTVAVGQAPQDGTEIADAVIVADTGASTAVDLALLICNGVAVEPNRIEIGTRTITKANRAAGGDKRVAPGDVLVAMLRMQHAAILTTTPKTDVVHPIGLITCEPDASWQAATKAAAVAAAAAYPQLSLLESADTSDQRSPAEQAKDLIARGCRALLLTTNDPATTKAVQTATADAAAPIIVLDPTVQPDHGVCVVGCSGEVLGKAAAAAVHELLPDGGSLITCVDSRSRDIVEGFCKAMGFASDRLLPR